MTPADQPGRVAVAMSGGVDSTAAAILLLEQGWAVMGLTMAHTPAARSDALQAERICARLGVPHETIAMEDVFEQEVVRPFADAYASGRTPSPCVVCNRRIKFGALMREARRLGCDRMATGHYARLVNDGSRIRLLRGADRSKDQSYFLHRLDQDQLRHSLMPLGTWSKDRVRELVKARGLADAPHSESQDLCFVGEGGATAVILSRRPDAAQEGEVTDAAGAVLGRHEGIFRYTIGQREGLNVATGNRMYVRALRPSTRTVEVGPRASLFAGGCVVRDVNWVDGAFPGEGPWLTQVRYRHAGARASVTPGDEEGDWNVSFESPQWAVTPGQAAVWYDGDRVLGGGWIERAWDVT